MQPQAAPSTHSAAAEQPPRDLPATPCKPATGQPKQNGVIDVSISPLPVVPAPASSAAEATGNPEQAPAVLTTAHLRPPPSAPVKSLAAVLMRPKQAAKPKAPLTAAMPPIHIASAAPQLTHAAPPTELQALRAARAAAVERERAARGAAVPVESLQAQLATSEAFWGAGVRLRETVERSTLPESARGVAHAPEQHCGPAGPAPPREGVGEAAVLAHAIEEPGKEDAADGAAEQVADAAATCAAPQAQAPASASEGLPWVQRHAPQRAADVCGNGDVVTRISTWLQGFGGGDDGPRCVPTDL